MNNKEFKKPNPFENDLQIKRKENTEFAKEFIDPLDSLKLSLNITRGEKESANENKK